jgi:hypothetical protein
MLKVIKPQPVYPPPEPLIDPDRKVLLFWTHRCASTTAQDWFLRLSGWRERHKELSVSKIVPLWKEENREAYDNLDRAFQDESYLKIAVVRNPLSRIVSSFSVVIDTATGTQWKAIARSLDKPDDDRRINLLEFLDVLEQIDLKTANYHWRLQSAQYWHERNLANVEIARVESLASDFARIDQKLGANIKLKTYSATGRTAFDGNPEDLLTMTRPDFERVFGRDKRGRIQFPDYKLFLAPIVRERVISIYRDDFRALGYPADAANSPSVTTKAGA